MTKNPLATTLLCRPGAWLTFGEGMRVCVGQRLALSEAKITLCHVFRRRMAWLSCPVCKTLCTCCEDMPQLQMARGLGWRVHGAA